MIGYNFLGFCKFTVLPSEEITRFVLAVWMDPYKMTAHFFWEHLTVWHHFATNYKLWFVVTGLDEINIQVGIVVLPFYCPFPVALVSEGTWFNTSSLHPAQKFQH